MRTKLVFVSGTDTGVGKTTVSCAILAQLSKMGYRVCGVKPVETGFIDAEESDAQKLLNASGAALELADILFYNFPQAVSPNVAARLANVEISKSEILSRLKVLTEGSFDLILVEAAGGIQVPFSPSFSWIDLLNEVQSTNILVVGSKLGAINHSVLSFESLCSREINLLGYVLSDLAQNDLAIETNRGAIAEQASRFAIKELAYIPHINDLNTQKRSSKLSDSEPIQLLCKRLIDYYQLAR